MMTKQTMGAILAVACSLALSGIAQAVIVPALAATNQGTRDDFSGVGVEFTVAPTRDLLLLSVGVWDYLGDGQAPYNIPLSLNDRTDPINGINANFTLPADSGHTLTYDVGEFRYMDITPLILLATHTYDLRVVYTPGGGEAWENFGLVSQGQLNGQNIFSSYGAFYDGSGGVALFNGAESGPNMLVSVVPEPASMAVLGLGGVALLRRRR